MYQALCQWLALPNRRTPDTTPNGDCSQRSSHRWQDHVAKRSSCAKRALKTQNRLPSCAWQALSLHWARVQGFRQLACEKQPSLDLAGSLLPQLLSKSRSPRQLRSLGFLVRASEGRRQLKASTAPKPQASKQCHSPDDASF